MTTHVIVITIALESEPGTQELAEFKELVMDVINVCWEGEETPPPRKFELHTLGPKANSIGTEVPK